MTVLVAEIFRNNRWFLFRGLGQDFRKATDMLAVPIGEVVRIRRISALEWRQRWDERKQFCQQNNL